MTGPAVHSLLDLWIVPTGALHESLARVIADLSHRYGTPEFVPHVTLTGAAEGSLEEVLGRTRRLASLLGPFTVWIGRPRLEDVYFRSLYLVVRKTAPLLRARRLAREVLGLPGAEYRPHLSLLYGDLTRSTKRAIADELKSLPLAAFTAESIHVVDTSPPVESWQTAGHFPFG